MKTIRTKLAAVALTLAALAGPSLAGKGGSNAKIVAAINSGSTDAIIAEVERAEGLICDDCIQTVTNLTEDNRYAVREVAAWWFAKRPGLAKVMGDQFKQDLVSADSTHVRNAADFLGATVDYTALPALRQAIARTGLTTEAKLAIVGAVGYLKHLDGNGILITAMSDTNASVRVAAIKAWRDVLGQVSVTPVEAKLADGDPTVRAAAATVIGAYGDRNALSTLEQLVVTDTDPFVRRNAAWALGQLGSKDASGALITASNDKSGLVRLVAKASLATLK
jgi:HEAT repeat protein